MPVDTPHPDYREHASEWLKLRDVLAGEKTVKKAGTKYLPRLADQSLYEYQGYVDRALFFNASARTVQGLLGAIFRKSPQVDVPEEVRSCLNSITFDNKPFGVFAKHVVQEVLSMGRYGILVDMADTADMAEKKADQKPYLAGYAAEQIINWRMESKNGRSQLSLVVLSETIERGGEDAFSVEAVQQYRVLSLDEQGRYIQTLFQEDRTGKYAAIHTIMPTFRGKPFYSIPFLFIGPVSMSAEVEKSPVLDLVNVNLSHYRSSADLEHGRHFTALPTPYVTSPSNGDEKPVFKIGPSNVWLLEPGGNAGMLEFQGAGLSFIENACREKERMMAVLGARLLEGQKNGVEAAEAIRLRHVGESSLLSSIADTVSHALTMALEYLAGWQGIDLETQSDAIQVDLNKDFLADRMNPAEIQSLVAAWQAGAISFESLQLNLEKGEII